MDIKSYFNDYTEKEKLELYVSSFQIHQWYLMFEMEYIKTLEFSVENLENRNDFYLSLNSKKFISYYIRNIFKPSDLHLLNKLKEKNKTKLLSILADDMTLSDIFFFAVFKNEKIIQDLPYGDWTEKMLRMYIKQLLESSIEKLDYNQLFPYNISYSNYIKEYILSWVYEEKRLEENAIIYFSNNFPKKYTQISNILNH